MLEKDFNELDNDFITIWSRLITNKPYGYLDIKTDLEKLAELGQVNAVQSYYNFMTASDKSNEIIDEIVNNYDNSNFNYTFAKALKVMVNDGYITTYIKNRNKLISNFNNCNSKKILNLAKQQCLHNFLKPDDKIDMLRNEPLYILRFGEIADTMQEKALFKKAVKKIFPNLVAKLLELKSTNNIENPQSAFAIAKFFYFFGKGKYKQIALNILSKLAKRPLSQTLNNYSLQIVTNNLMAKQLEKIKSKYFVRENIDSLKLWELGCNGRYSTPEEEREEVEKFKKFLNSDTAKRLHERLDEIERKNIKH